MNSSQKKTLQIVGVTALLIALPLVIFPKLFGFQPLRPSWQYFFYEVVFYGFVSVIMFGSRSLISVLKVAAATLAYRLAISATVGLIIAALYSMDFKVAMTLALISYLPGVVIQIVLSPAALWPVLSVLAGRQVRTRAVPRREPVMPLTEAQPRTPFPSSQGRERSPFVDSTLRPRETKQPEVPLMHARNVSEPSSVTVTSDLNGFERAVRYISEHGSVYFAAVVDPEGLLLANYHRGRTEPEDMAPLAVMFFEWNRAVLSKGRLGEAEKIDITLKEKRLILGRIGDWCLMVLSERQADDLLNIRINQGMDMLRKYSSERSASGPQTQVEKTYV